MSHCWFFSLLALSLIKFDQKGKIKQSFPLCRCVVFDSLRPIHSKINLSLLNGVFIFISLKWGTSCCATMSNNLRKMRKPFSVLSLGLFYRSPARNRNISSEYENTRAHHIRYRYKTCNFLYWPNRTLIPPINHPISIRHRRFHPFPQFFRVVSAKKNRIVKMLKGKNPSFMGGWRCTPL